MTQHILPGLRPAPLASYLAGLGLIRLIGDQADPELRAAWTDEGLTIETTVDELATWLVDRYVPTPVLSPWNEGSGFGAKDKTPKQSLDALVGLPTPRLDLFRVAVKVATDVATRYRAEETWDKERAIKEFRNRCPDELLPWIDATVVLAGGQAYFPPLLGTGGNDGRLDFSTTFHQRLLEVLDPAAGARQRSFSQVRDLLTGIQTERLSAAAIGQFDPGASGGRNSSPFGGADSLVNPWAFVLLIEGTLWFASSTARRNQHGIGRAAMPFTVIASPDGSGTGVADESSRGEVWAPVWRTPFTPAEIRQLFTEARASWRGRPAQRAVEFYAATRTLGVARGVDAFVRYGLHQRNGLAYAAVPVEQVTVTEKPAVRLAARLEEWVSWVRSSKVSAAVGRAVRRVETAEWAFVGDGCADSLARLLAAVTDLEQAVGRSGRARDSISPRRPPSARSFLKILQQENCLELRVAAGIASCATRSGPDPGREPARTMRQLLLPIDPGPRWRDTPVISGFGLRPLREVLADVLTWRARTAADEPGRDVTQRPPFRGVPTFLNGLAVPAADLHAFATGQLNEGLLDLWLRACLALDWRGVRHLWVTSDTPMVPVPTLGLLHLLAAGLAPGTGDTRAPRDPQVPLLALSPDWPNRLASGQVDKVHAEAVRRLRQAGWEAVPLPPGMPGSGIDGTAIAAALVPRCQGAQRVMREHLATRIRTDNDESNDLSNDDTQAPELMEELS